ncbi:MAG: hypothetical protein EBX52_00895 [Proteobacteria bacterium]|nr:hypothetical protein [Pseudomonadota bacterium]
MRDRVFSLILAMALASGILPFRGDCVAQVMSTFVREQVGTLPKGRFMVSFVSVNASIDSMYGAGGQSQALSTNLNQNITFQKITEQDPVRGNQLAGLFLANGVNLSDSAGALMGTIQGTVSGKVPVLGYGLADDLGLFVSVPVLNFNIQSAYQLDQSASTKAFLSRLNSNDQTSVANEMNAALNSSLETKLYSAGIAWDPNLNRNYLGDVQISVIKVVQPGPGSTLRQSFQPGIVLPTATDQDIHDLYGLRAGDRRFGVGMKYALQQEILLGLQFNLGVGGTFLFPAHQGRRIPRDYGDGLNELVDPDAQVSGGAKMQSQLQLRYPFPRWVGLNAGMLWQKKFEETITGSAYAPVQYLIASSRTASDLFSGYASLDLNSIPSFLEGGFLLPAIAEVGVGIPLAGANAISEPVFQLQGTLFF